MWSGGLLCAGTTGLPALCLPGLTVYDARADEHAVRLREQCTAAAPTQV